MKKLLSAILVLSSVVSLAFAQPAIVQLPMIRSAGALKAFALSQSVSGSLQVSSSEITGNGYVQQAFYIPYRLEDEKVIQLSGVESLFQQIGSYQFNFSVTRVTDPMDINVSLFNRDGYQLFYGYQQTKLSPNGPQYWIDGVVQLTMSSTIPIPFPGVKSARIVVRQTNGDVQRNQSLNVGNGYIFYPVAAAEHSGEVMVSREIRGIVSEQVFDIPTGALRPVTSVAGGVGVGVRGLYNFGINPWSVGLFGVDDIRAAVAYFELQPVGDRSHPGDGTPMVKIGASSPKEKAPLGFIIRRRDLPLFVEPWIFNVLTGNENWFFTKGKWELVYIFSLADLDGLPVVFPDDGGKG